MPKPDFIYRNSRFFENLLEHQFLADLSKYLVLQEPPRLLNVLKSEVDAFGFDLVLSVDSRTIQVQMKTRSGKPTSFQYELSDLLWETENSCAVWVMYDQATLVPTSYQLLGMQMPEIEQFPRSDRPRYRKVRINQVNHRDLTLEQLSNLVFPANA